MKLINLFPCLLFPLFVLGISYQKVTNAEKNYLPQKRIDEVPKENSVFPMELRSLNDWKVTDLLLVSDVDGNLHGVERNTGSFLWTLPIDEPLVKILGSSDGSSSEPNMLWFVEPFQEGSLYYFAPQYGLNKLPTSIKNLVMASPFSLNGDEKIYIGSRKTSLYTININTGEMLCQFGSLDDEKCPIPNLYRSPHTYTMTEENTILIGKTTYELSIHSKLDSNVMWNVSYSMWGPNNIDNDLIMQNEQSTDNLYFTPFHDKSLLAIDKQIGTPAWITKLPSLAVNVFDIFNSNSNKENYVILPHPLKVLNNLQMNENDPNNDLCFINKTRNGEEWFAMSFLNYPTLLKSAPVSNYQMGLYKYDNGILTDQEINFIKNFSLADPGNELLLSGVHKLNHLYPENLYQPTQKFSSSKVNLIGDGSQPTGHHSAQVTNSPDDVPTIMNGILFPVSKAQFARDVATINHGDNHLQVNEHSSSLPPAYYQLDSRNIYDETRNRESLSVFRRIFEDLFVMSALFLFLMALSKCNQMLRDRREWRNTKVAGEMERNTNPTRIEHLNTARFADEELKPELLSPIDMKITDKKVDFVTLEAEGNGAVSEEDIEMNDKDATEGEEFPESELTNTKKKRKRGSRGGKRGGKGKRNLGKNEGDIDDEIVGELRGYESTEENNNVEPVATATRSLVRSFTKPVNLVKRLHIDSNLVISDKILGYGSHGTVVYEGSFENRPVAVKRMLLDFYEIANHEVRLLQESDDHPNVVRYFCSQSSEKEKFLYIALELCSCSLDEIIERKHPISQTLGISSGFHRDALHQLASGLHYLHSLKIVHRDLKPQNILVGEAGKSKMDPSSSSRLLISDFGLCKKLDADQSSFRATTQNAASGTSGWRAPELLLSHDLLEISPDTVSSINSNSRHSIKDGANNSGPGVKRLTKAIDIFSLGCVFYYILSAGGHPFGDRYLREGNIIRGEFDLSPLEKFCPNDFVEATKLISSMIAASPKSRPDTAAILKHPYFWSAGKKLEFLLKVSDRFEIERRDPPSNLLIKLELAGPKVHSGDWLSRFDAAFLNNLGKYRKYQQDKLMDLLRALRNKYHHFNDMPATLQKEMSPLPTQFYNYFNSRFPQLLMEIYHVVKADLSDEHIFHEFFENPT